LKWYLGGENEHQHLKGPNHLSYDMGNCQEAIIPVGLHIFEQPLY